MPTSVEARNLEVVRGAFDAFKAGNAEAMMKAMAPNIHYHLAPSANFTGDYRGVQAVMGFFGQIAQESQGTFQVELLEAAASGERVFVLYKVTGKRGAKTLDASDVGVFTLADGAITDAMIYAGDYPAGAAFWS